MSKSLLPRAASAAIMDFSKVASFNVSSQTVRDLARRPPVMPGSQPRFLVAPFIQIYGLARMFQQYGSEERPQLHVVRSLDEAYALLGVPEPQFEPVGEGVAVTGDAGVCALRATIQPPASPVAA